MTTQRLDLFSWRHLSWHQMFIRTAAILSLALLVSAYAALPGLNVFGHDDVIYYPDWNFKLIEEGRWVNFLLHDFLRSIPPGTWAVTLLVSAWILFFRLGRSCNFDIPYSTLVASTIVLCAPLVEQSIWPATDMSAVIILLLVGVLAERDVPFPVIYVFSGILLFGALQSFYFLVPLFFIGNFLDTSDNDEQRRLNLFKHLVWWVLGSIVGVLFVFTILWLKTGHFGIQPAAWRLTRPIHDFAGLIRNIRLVTNAFWGYNAQLLKSANVFSSWFFASIVLICIVRIRGLIAIRHAIVLVAAVAAGFFVFSIPLAPRIELRNLIALGAALIFFIALLPGSSSLGRFVGTLLLLALSYGFSTYGESFISRHRTETNFFYHKLQQLMPGPPSSYSAVALFGLMSEKSSDAGLFNNGPRMYAIFRALGVENYHDCRRFMDKLCSTLVASKPLAMAPLGRGHLLFSINANNIAIIHFQEGSSASVTPNNGN
jgi:hypothetical protein